jgi:hypothetical protein
VSEQGCEPSTSRGAAARETSRRRPLCRRARAGAVRDRRRRPSCARALTLSTGCAGTRALRRLRRMFSSRITNGRSSRSTAAGTASHVALSRFASRPSPCSAGSPVARGSAAPLLLCERRGGHELVDQPLSVPARRSR